VRGVGGRQTTCDGIRRLWGGGLGFFSRVKKTQGFGQKQRFVSPSAFTKGVGKGLHEEPEGVHYQAVCYDTFWLFKNKRLHGVLGNTG